MSPLSPIRQILTDPTLTTDEKKAAMRGHFECLLDNPDVGRRNEDMKFRADQRLTIATQVKLQGGRVRQDYEPLIGDL